VGVWLGALRVFRPVEEQAFLGNPNARIASIDVSAGIDVVNDALDRYTPSFVHCTALDVTATGEYVDTDETTLTALSAYLNPYEDLEYRWSVSVLSGSLTTETMTSPTDGATVDLFEDQIGAEALFVFRNAGTYRITRDVRGRDSAGTGYITASSYKDIVVTDFDDLAKPEFFFDSVNGNDSWAGTVGTPNAGTFPSWTGATNGPKQTAAAIKTIFINPTYHSGVIINLAQGSTFTITNSGAWSAGGDDGLSPYRIRDYVGGSGAGAKPIIQKDYTAGTNTGEFLVSNWSSGTVGGNVISNISFISTNCDETVSLWAANAAGNNNTVKHYYWDNCDFYLEGAGVGSGIEPTIVGIYTNGSNRGLGQQGIGFYKCSLTADGGQIGMGIQAVAWAGWSVVGCTFSALNGAIVSQANTEHWIYPHVRSRSLYRWTTFHAIGGGFCINGNWDTSGVQDPDQESFYVGDCLFDGTTGNSGSCSIDVGQGADGTGDNSGPDTQYLNVVTERCAFHGFRHSNQMQEADGECVTSRTLRGNRVWDNSSWFAPPSFNAVYKIYQNRIYRPEGSTGCVFGWSADAKFAPSMITDNIFVGDDIVTDGSIEGSYFMNWDSAAHVTQGSYCDRNQYFGYNIGNVDLFGLTHAAKDKNLTQWQAAGWDVNSTLLFMKNPRWIRPVTQWSDMDDGAEALPPLLRVGDTVTPAEMKAAVIAEVFKGSPYSGAVPSLGTTYDRRTLSTTDPLAAFGLTPSNYDHTDLYEFDEYDDDAVLVGTCKIWHIHPTAGTSINEASLLIFGHTSNANSFNAGKQGHMVRDIVESGRDCFVGYMSASGDLASFPTVQFHNSLPDPTADYNPLRIYVAPWVRMLNVMAGMSFAKTFGCGVSGGGWMGPLLCAIDSRVELYVSHAGFVPLFIGEDRDKEQKLLGLVDMAEGCDYPDLVATAVANGCQFIESHSTDEPTLCSKIIFSNESQYDYVTALEDYAVGKSGTYEFLSKVHTVHEWSDALRPDVINRFDNAA
jgi:hypothetical protein